MVILCDVYHAGAIILKKNRTARPTAPRLDHLEPGEPTHAGVLGGAEVARVRDDGAEVVGQPLEVGEAEGRGAGEGLPGEGEDAMLRQRVQQEPHLTGPA